MDVNKLVESIVKPFLMEDTNLEYDGCVPAAKNDDNYPMGLDECGMLNQILQMSSIPSIQNFANVPDIDGLKKKFAKEKNVSASWEQRNSDMADKLGYELIDYIDGDINNRQVPVNLDADNSFMDITGQLCEEYSIRDKVRQNLKKKKFITENKYVILKLLCEDINDNDVIEGGTRDIAPFATLDGYNKFSRDRATTSGLEIVKELFNPNQVFAINKIEIKMDSNTLKFYNDNNITANTIEIDKTEKLHESIKDVGKWYLSYINEEARDGEMPNYLNKRNQDNQGGEIGKGKNGGVGFGEKRGTPKFDDSSVPTGDGDKENLDGNPDTHVNVGYKEIDKKGKSEVDDRVTTVDEWNDRSQLTATDSSNQIKMYKGGGIGKGDNDGGTSPMANSTDTKNIPKNNQSGDGHTGEFNNEPKSYTKHVGDEDEKLIKAVKSK